MRHVYPAPDEETERSVAAIYADRRSALDTSLVATMGLLGLTLALIGLYGLIAPVSRRTEEIGIRMAIGADQGRGLAHGAPARFHPVRPPGFR